MLLATKAHGTTSAATLGVEPSRATFRPRDYYNSRTASAARCSTAGADQHRARRAVELARRPALLARPVARALLAAEGDVGVDARSGLVDAHQAGVERP